MIPRAPNWPEALADHVERRRNVPHQWGTNDCCRYVADAILAMTGRDPMADLRGVTTARAAARLLRTTSLQALVTQRLGEPLPSPLLAQRGDAVLVLQAGEPLLALCLGESWAAPGLAGVVVADMQRAVTAWAVGR